MRHEFGSWALCEAQDLTTLATLRLPCPTAFHSLRAASIAERIRSHRPLIITSASWR